MAFIETADFTATIHTEILDALTNGEAQVITDNIDRTIDEVSAYLNGRYDTANIFNKTGTDRNKYVLRICVTMATYYIYLAHNPRKMTQVTADEFARAIETLEGIQAGKINPVGLALPAADDTETGTTSAGQSFQWGSDLSLGTSW